jgi:manganese transport protein
LATPFGDAFSGRRSSFQLYGEKGTIDLLILSQVILALQLSFAVVPLVSFTSNRLKMGEFVNPIWLKILVIIISAIIIALNIYLLWSMFLKN